MKILAINGGPRKQHNTATLLYKVMEGARSQGAEIELLHLYDLSFKGCRSCFACKEVNSDNFGRCVVKDDLTDVYDRLTEFDGIVLGSPIYFGTDTGMMRMFRERLLCPLLTYDTEQMVLFPKQIHTAQIYTMNVTEAQAKTMGLDSFLMFVELSMRLTFGTTETLLCYDTYQFDDYSKYKVTLFDEKKKAQVRETMFPQDCQKAFDLGLRMAQGSAPLHNKISYRPKEETFIEF